MIFHPDLPKVKICEQPEKKGPRFRYESERTTGGAIHGITSTNEEETFPSIEVENYDGEVYVVVSCVTIDFPHK